MDILYSVFVIVHLLSMAAIVGGYLSVVTKPRINDVMVWGARIAFLVGIIIVGLGEAVESLDRDYDMVKISVKLVIALVVVACAEIARARQKRGEPVVNLVHAVGGLAIVNVFIAVLWS